MGMRIVVGVDGSQAAGRALVWAAEAASRDHGQLVIAHGGEVPAKTDVASGDATDDSRNLLREAVATAIDVGRHCDVTTVLRDVAPAQLLLDLSNEAQTLVVGTRGRGRIVGVLLGSVAYRVAAHARCPVVVVPEDWRAPGDASHLIAVGVSNSSSGHEALAYALAEAERRGSALVAVRSWPERDSGAQPGDAAGNGNETVRQQQQQLLSALVDRARAEHPGVDVITDLTSEPVYDALFAAAGKADLLVLGCRHDDEHRFSRLGPIASRLLHTAPCPVAIVGHPLAQDPPELPDQAADEHALERA